VITDASRCPACDSRISSPLFRKEGFRYVECARCGVAYLDPVPSPEEAMALYDDGYFAGPVGGGGYADYGADEGLHRRNARDRLAVVQAAWAGAAGALLDVGCAFGFFLDEAGRAGWQVEGVEVASTPAAYARGELGLTVHPDLAALAPERREAFDVVTFFQVLAHLARPAEALDQARTLVRPGGLLVIETSNRRSRMARLLGRHWQFVTPPEIVCLFDPESLDRLLDRHGFERVDLRRAPKTVSVRFAGSVLAHKYPRLARPVQLVTEQRRLAGRGLRYDLGDLMTVVARPRDAQTRGKR
jgi:SAM-dependent methyltransferase